MSKNLNVDSLKNVGSNITNFAGSIGEGVGGIAGTVGGGVKDITGSVFGGVGDMADTVLGGVGDIAGHVGNHGKAFGNMSLKIAKKVDFLKIIEEDAPLE